jgi:hypothetical protein
MPSFILGTFLKRGDHLRDLKQRWEDNIKIYPKGIE